MQGPVRSRGLRIRASLVLGAAFVCAATVVFALVALLGRLVGASGLPVDWRVGLAAAGLLALAAVDVHARRKSVYCPLSLRRQTPKSLVHRRSATLVAAAWGFDTGLAVTTVRVAAITWGAMLLAVLDLSDGLTGLAYGSGFAIPFVYLLWTHRVGRLASASGPVDPGLESMLARRASIQRLSAVLLTVGGAVLAGAALTS